MLSSNKKSLEIKYVPFFFYFTKLLNWPVNKQKPAMCHESFEEIEKDGWEEDIKHKKTQ